MKTILLACNAGMSTSLLVQKMQKEAQAQGLDVQIKANPLNKALELVDEAVVLPLRISRRKARNGYRRREA